MERATRAAPRAVTRAGGITIAPAGSAVLAVAIAVALGSSIAIAAVARGGRGGVEVRSDAVGAAVAAGVGSRIAARRTAEPGAGGPSVAVPDVPWLAERGDGVWLFGRGPTARALPTGESGLAIDERYVATTSPGADGRSTIHLRAASSGDRIRDISAPIWVSSGAWTVRGLVVTGYRDASMRDDGGLILVTAEGSARVLVPAGPFSAALGRPVARGDVLVSPSRQVAASNVCGITLCDSQIVDVTSGVTSRPSRAAEGFLRAVTDDVVVTTDSDARWISARRISDGGEVWRLTDTVLLDPMPTARGSLVGVVGSRASGWGVDAIDPAGRSRRLTRRVGLDAPWPRVWTQVSTPETVVIGHASFGEAVGTTAGADVEVVGTDPARPASATARFVLSIPPEAMR